uniref:Serpin domain-containing protein n=1 Tax=Stomoxys calcitrans TaxID=35570 RepID=A0A1I8Q8A1_STOCA
MRILSSCSFTFALFVLLAFANASAQIANDGLIAQTSSNPLNIANGQVPMAPIFSPQPVSTSRRPTFSTGSSAPQFSLLSSGATVNEFSASPQLPVGDANSVMEMVAENVLQFGHDIAHRINELDPYGSRSEIFSPLSVMSALSLLMLGSRGKSYQELKKLIGLDKSIELERHPSTYHEIFGSMLSDMEHFDVNANNEVPTQRKSPPWRHSMSMNMNPRGGKKPEGILHTISVANGLFVQTGYSLNPDYSQVVSSIYDSQLTQLDFIRKSREAVKYINNWVNGSTNGKISEIITGDISSSTNVVLASVLYFRGLWEIPFFPRSTNVDNFYQDGPGSPPIRAKFMATGGIFPFYDAKDYDCRIIGLPYKGNETTMYVIQPNASTRQKLKELMSVLDARKINEMIDRMVYKTTVMVFPKMHFTRTMNMKNILQSMGVSDIFNGVRSDLSLIGGGRTFAAPPLAAAPLPPGSPTPDGAPPPVTAHRLAAAQGLAITPICCADRFRTKNSKPQFYDRYNERLLIFTSRFGDIDATYESTTSGSTTSESTTSESTSSESTTSDSTTLDSNEMKHKIRKRQVPNAYDQRNVQALANLESDRFRQDIMRSDLFVDEIVHKVDIGIDEYGTEAAAATAAYLHRSGTDVVFRGDTPFLFVIRHDPTKLPLFYGIVNKPELD